MLEENRPFITGICEEGPSSLDYCSSQQMYQDTIVEMKGNVFPVRADGDKHLVFGGVQYNWAETSALLDSGLIREDILPEEVIFPNYRRSSPVPMVEATEGVAVDYHGNWRTGETVYAGPVDAPFEQTCEAKGGNICTEGQQWFHHHIHMCE